MPIYNAPLEDMRFILNDVFKVEDFWKSTEDLSFLDIATADAILEEMAKFSKNVLLPINRSGDEEGARIEDGQVYTPKGFKEAFKQYAEGGWMSLAGDPEYGGQGMPKMLTMMSEEMLMATNQSFTLYPNLTNGACLAINAYGSDEQKAMYLPRFYSGEWAGTMCLTEPHAGTDLGIIRTKAVPNDDGSYAISGTKIFITGGDHDLTDNIVHLVLAKTPDAPAGTRGISMFIVPKFMHDDEGNVGERNGAGPGSIEHKMGIKASATCVMNFDNAKGWLIGPENKGLNAMFVMMNYERLTMGLQGLGGSETAYQNAAAYALDRLQGRASSGVTSPEKEADPILHHPDVRRMLLNAKSHNEAARCFAVYVAKFLDTAKFSSDEAAVKEAHDRVALLTPVAKGFLTDMALDACIDSQQVFGGHGYVREWGMEQLVRDTRIAQIYEGTNGIQALDLVGRKIVKNGGAFLTPYLEEIKTFAGGMSAENAFMKDALLDAVSTIEDTTNQLMALVKDNIDEINASCVDYMHAFGLMSYAYMFAMMVEAAQEQSGDFYSAKPKLAEFFVKRRLPELKARAAMALAGADTLMDMSDEYFAQAL
jgi:alkylation response protein AidB-like acyl-CoA dehydrogenase